jgi:hypothetical protein
MVVRRENPLHNAQRLMLSGQRSGVMRRGWTPYGTLADVHHLNSLIIS